MYTTKNSRIMGYQMANLQYSTQQKNYIVLKEVEN